MFKPWQQARYSPLVQLAWRAWCSENFIDPQDEVERDRWYRGNLLRCIGVPTTRGCSPGRDYYIVMRHFTHLADVQKVSALKSR